MRGLQVTTNAFTLHELPLAFVICFLSTGKLCLALRIEVKVIIAYHCYLPGTTIKLPKQVNLILKQYDKLLVQMGKQAQRNHGLSKVT